MKGFKLILIYLLGMSGSLCAAERLDEDMAKALIVRQLLSLIEGHDGPGKANESEQYVLCTYQDKSTSQKLGRHLKGLSVKQKPFTIKNITQREDFAGCYAAFINEPNKDDLDSFIEQGLVRNTLFIIHGQKYAAQGFHIGLYLNKQNTFDFELNPDALMASNFTPREELLQFGNILKTGILQKINLLRTLINYTDWSTDSQNFKSSKEFSLCTLRNKTLDVFIRYAATSKTFKGKTLKNQIIESADQAPNCDAVILDSSDDQDSLTLLSLRAKQQVLLIGNHQNFGEKGVHYNLQPGSSSQRRFEMNLIAFEQTGHSPHFELYNSAVVVKKDYPEFSRTLSQIIQLTQWPDDKESANAKAPVDLCVYRDEAMLDNLQLFLSSNAMDEKMLATKSITTRLVDEQGQLNSCDAFLAGNIDGQSLTELLRRQPDKPILLISNHKNQSANFHYQVLMAPKEVTFALNLKNLQAGGFIPAQTLMNLGKVIGGGAE